MNRSVAVSLGAVMTILAMAYVARYLAERAAPLWLVSLAVFWTARLAGAAVDRALVRKSPLGFYEDVLKDLLIYSLLAGVTTLAIWVSGQLVEVQVNPLGPAVVIHLVTLLFRRSQV